MAKWSSVPKGAHCKKRDWVSYDNGSFITGTLEGWGEEEIYLMATCRGDQPLILAMMADEAAALCRVLSTALLDHIWRKREGKGDE